MKRSIIAAALAMAAAPALAQPVAGPTEIQKPSAWSRGVELSFSPRIGRRNPFDTTQDLVDESEYELNFSLTNKSIKGLPLAATVGLTWSPQQFDKEDPESGLYGELMAGDDYRPIHRLRRSGSTKDASDDVLDAVRPYGSLRYTRVYRRPLEGFVRNEREIGAGIRLRNVLTIMCEERMLSADKVGACSDTPGISWEVRAEAAKIWSSSPEEERLAPKVKGEVISALVGGLRFFGRGEYEFRFYDNAVVPGTSEKREDRRLRLGAGVDLSELTDPVSLDFELQFQRRWSNDPDRRHERFYFVPSLTISAGF